MMKTDIGFVKKICAKLYLFSSQRLEFTICYIEYISGKLDYLRLIYFDDIKISYLLFMLGVNQKDVKNREHCNFEL